MMMMSNTSIGAEATVPDIEQLEREYTRSLVEFQPWLDKPQDIWNEQTLIQEVLKTRSKCRFGKGSFIARNARILTNRFEIGAGSWVAAGAIIRGDVKIGDDCSVNPFAHIAGRVTIGSGVRIAGMVSIYGFNHGFARTDVPIYRQEHTQKGIRIGDGTWIGANAVIVDGVEIGPHCIVAAGAVVTGSFPAYQIIGGNPARVIRARMEGGVI
jgi:acetyltransferase-like isoleucine patch superfamily enzyme